MFSHCMFYSYLKIYNPKISFKGKLLLKLLSLNEEHFTLNFIKVVIQNKELFVPRLMNYWKACG